MEYKKYSIENQNDLRKSIMWNKSLTTNNSFVKIKSGMEIDYGFTLSESTTCTVTTHHWSMEHKNANIAFNGWQQWQHCWMDDRNSRTSSFQPEKIDTGHSNHSVLDLPRLDYEDRLARIFMDWWDRTKPNKRLRLRKVIGLVKKTYNFQPENILKFD